MNNKKAACGALMVLILGGIIIIIFAAMFPKIKWAFDSGSYIENCHMSMIAQSKIKVVGKTVVPLQCPREQITFYKDHIESVIEGKKKEVKVTVEGEKKDEFKELTDNIVNEVFADKMRWCWYMSGEGNLDPFAEAAVFGVAKDKICLLCSSIKFDDEVDKSKKFEGLGDYLKSKDIKEGSGEGKKYYDYLSKEQLIEVFWIDIDTKESLQMYDIKEINPDKTYAVFMLAGKANALDDFTDIQEDTYFIYVAPIERVTSRYKGVDVCNVLL